MGAADGDDPGDRGDAAARGEMVHLPTASCPMCGVGGVVAEIEVGQTPILSCLSCGRSSRGQPGDVDG